MCVPCAICVQPIKGITNVRVYSKWISVEKTVSTPKRSWGEASFLYFSWLYVVCYLSAKELYSNYVNYYYIE